MTATEDIRAEAVRRYSDPKSRATDFGRHASANEIAGFMDGAKWMASQAISDEQVEAAAAVLRSHFEKDDYVGRWDLLARVALEAARGVQS